MSITRQQAIKVYKQIMKISKKWTAEDMKNTNEEKNYIANEARRLFKLNKNIKDNETIKQHILEAEGRLEIALHYKNPYPRPVNVPPEVLSRSQNKNFGKLDKKRNLASRPVYLKSLERDFHI